MIRTTAVVALLSVSATNLADELRRDIDIPEPMVFDLVHGLGVERGAFEANVLALFPLNDTSIRPVDWAPEVEYAIRDGIAVEFELPFADSELEAYKFAVQFTHAKSLEHRRIHGSQFIVEKFDNEDIWELTGLYLLGIEFSETWSAMTRLGLRATTGSDISDHEELLANFTLFRELSHRWVFGIENDLAVDLDDDWGLLVFPQFHYEIGEFLEIQFGAGAEIDDDDTDFSAGFRFIYATAGGGR